MTSPTQRTLKWFRDHGWLCCVVEKWVPYAKIRVDAMGFGDLLICKAGEGIALVQATSGANLAAREAKVRANENAWKWLEAGGLIFVVGWSKRGPRGKRKLWAPDVREIKAEERARCR